MQALPGFRDFFPAECARRNRIYTIWRDVARRHGFVEFDGPVLEPVDLYRKKSGGEIAGQLFDFADKGGREVALRPEMTPTLARMVAAAHREYRKPIKWFSVGSCFRYEKPQRGRLREFAQLNCDILGDASPGAEADLLALAADILLALGIGRDRFAIRLSHRGAWGDFLAARGVAADRVPAALEVVDKLGRAKREETERALAGFGLSLADVEAFVANPADGAPALAGLREALADRDLDDLVRIDLSVVRGLAYYTGAVFELFDRDGALRAIAGGGRYDGLVATMSDGKVDLPAAGFGMGDVVLGEMIASCEQAEALMRAAVGRALGVQVYIVVADEGRRRAAMGVARRCRALGYSVEIAPPGTKVAKQFQAGSASGARAALVVGGEWPLVRVKDLGAREEASVPAEELANRLAAICNPPA